MKTRFASVPVGFLLILGSASAEGAERVENTDEVNDAAGSAFPGSVLGLTLLIDFEEAPATFSKEEVEKFLNQPGYDGHVKSGSHYDYWYEASGGKLRYTNHVADYFRAPHDKAYYNQAFVGNKQIKELIVQALETLQATGFDFSTLTTNDQGEILAINVFYAGDRGSGKRGLTPHVRQIRGLFESDGVKSGNYQLTPMDDALILRHFVHENGHMLFGWEDLYDTRGVPSAGIGPYGLMGGPSPSNVWGPMPPNPYYRHLAGWDEVTDLTDAPPGVYHMEANSNKTYVFYNPATKTERFYIETKKTSGKGRNMAVPDEGLLIWHIDAKMPRNIHQEMTPEKHYEVSVEQADGLFQLEKGNHRRGDGDLFHAGGNDAFTNESVPASKWWNGRKSGLNIVNISAVGDTMSFELVREVEDEQHVSPGN